MPHRKVAATLLVAVFALLGVSADGVPADGVDAKVGHAKVEWPPRVGEPFPNLEFTNPAGETVRLSDFKGSVLLVEYVGMTCPGCQAFSGAHRVGGFGGVRPQPGLKSIEEYFPEHAGGVSLDDKRIVFVQLLLYNQKMGAPSTAEVKEWAKHFRLEGSKNQIVLAGTKDLLGPASFKLIPGFQLVDRNSVMRSDSTGHNPRHNLYTHLLPLVPELLKESSPRESAVRLLAAFGQPAMSSGGGQRARRSNADGSRRPSMSVEDAYRAIPHRRTVFGAKAANMPASGKRFLKAFFELVDEAIVARVDTTSQLLAGRKPPPVAPRYDAILADFERLPTPGALRDVKRLVTSAVREQQSFLEAAAKKGRLRKSDLAREPQVDSSSRKLRQAYSELMRHFSQETPKNRQAFFDYLCALDFI